MASDASTSIVSEVTSEVIELVVEEKELVSIEKISEVIKHPNADNLYIATVLGYKVIINIANMYGVNTKPEDLVGKNIVYFQIDSVMPEIFKNEGFWNYLKNTYMGKKIISAKLRGLISQGMVIDFESIASLFPKLTVETLRSLPEGYNLTNDVGVIKYYEIYDAEGPIYGGAFDRSKYKTRISPACLRPFPEFLQKTDQPKLQVQYKILRRMMCEEQVGVGKMTEEQFAETKTVDLPIPNRLFTTTVKFDGQSVQWFKKAHRVGVCSRNFEVLLEYELGDNADSANNKFREMDKKYGIMDKLQKYPRDISIQTEMYGMSINGNRHKKNDIDLVVFDVFDVDSGSMLSHKEMVAICKEFGLPHVPVVSENQPLISLSVDKWVELASTVRYTGGFLAEGIVVKSSDDKYPYVHFKVISPAYLIKHGI